MVKVNPIKILPTLIALGVIAIVCVLHILPLIYPNFSLLQELEWKTYDWRVRSAFRTNAESAKMLGAVLIDDDTIAEINEDYKFTYPFPRKLYGYVVRELKAQGAKVVGFDILFSELHGSNAAIDFKLSSGMTMTSDEFFARQLNRASNVVLAVMGGESVGTSGRRCRQPRSFGPMLSLSAISPRTPTRMACFAGRWRFAMIPTWADSGTWESSSPPRNWEST